MPNINARIKNKHDTEANWKLAENFKPLAGEVIVYDVDSNHAYPRFKVGDGEKFVNDLPFSTLEYMTDDEVDALFATTIQFTIQGKSYTANKNSTWQEWLNGIGAGETSVYGDAFGTDSSIVRTGPYAVHYNGNEVSVNDTIIENAAYTLEQVTGGGSVIG